MLGIRQKGHLVCSVDKEESLITGPRYRGASPSEARSQEELLAWRIGRDHPGRPNPASRSVDSSGPRPRQQLASRPSIATAGTELTPSSRARAATASSCMSRTSTSQEGQAIRFTSAMVSSQAGHPAEKTSIFRFADIGNLPLKVISHCKLTSLRVFPRDPFGDVGQAQRAYNRCYTDPLPSRCSERNDFEPV